MNDEQLLDAFASAALTGYLSREGISMHTTLENRARTCYKMAQAMLDEKKRLQEEKESE